MTKVINTNNTDNKLPGSILNCVGLGVAWLVSALLETCLLQV